MLQSEKENYYHQLRKIENLPSIYAKVPADCTKKIESAKEIFSNIIKHTAWKL